MFGCGSIEDVVSVRVVHQAKLDTRAIDRIVMGFSFGMSLLVKPMVLGALLTIKEASI